MDVKWRMLFRPADNRAGSVHIVITQCRDTNFSESCEVLEHGERKTGLSLYHCGKASKVSISI